MINDQPPLSSARTVRSFVIRGGRITTAQQRALGDLWPQFGIDYSAAPLDLPALFGNTQPCTVEIGFGNGDHLLVRAQREPQRNFLGIEVHRPGVGRVLLNLKRAQLRNVRVICHDAVEVLRDQLKDGSIDELQILFPDPWHKKRHHKRRLIDTDFVALAASRLRPAGLLGLATDWEPYAQHMLAVLSACPTLENAVTEGGFAPRPETRIVTRFENRGVLRGHVVHDLLWRRRS